MTTPHDVFLTEFFGQVTKLSDELAGIAEEFKERTGKKFNKQLFEKFVDHEPPGTYPTIRAAYNVFIGHPELNDKQDLVNHPSHYTFGRFEVIDVIDDWNLGFYEGQVVKYVARAKHKRNELEDLKKASWYLTRLIANMEKKRANR